MLSYEQILKLIDKLVDTPLTEISVAQGDFSMSLKKETQQAENITSTVLGVPPVAYSSAPAQSASTLEATPKAPTPAVVSNLIDVTSPMVGTFYAAPSPDSATFVEVGKKIKPGDVLCIIEAMKMMNELPAEVSGTIEEVCVQNAQTVEFGQVLFRIKPL